MNFRTHTLLLPMLGLASFVLCSGQTKPATTAPSTVNPPTDKLVLPPPNVTPKEFGLKGSGISGPSTPTAADWRKHLPTGARPGNGTAVTQGILPPIKPLLNLHIRDTVVILGGDGNYYMTGSTGDDIWSFSDGVELWRSPDLKTWTYLGMVWSIEKEGTWEKNWENLHNKATRAIWAPEIHYIKSMNNYFICLSMAPSGISLLKSTTGKPEGPYVNAVPGGKQLTGGIDATLFEDDDGKVYFTNSSATRIHLMKDDMSGFAETYPIVLQNPDHTPSHHSKKDVDRGSNDIGNEGAELFKANGKYYLGAADTYEGRYSTCVAISDNIKGPYTMRHESVPCAGGTDFFKDKDGNWWTAYFGNDNQSPFREMPAIVRIDFAPDGKIIVADEQPSFILEDGSNTHWRKK